MKNPYRCCFNFPEGDKYAPLYYVRVESIHEIKDGFWINSKKKFTKKSDCRYWIPPSQIMFVEKLEPTDS